MFIAHRGYYDEYIPENSIEAFKRCIVRGISIELDVRLTKDKKVVVFHDSNLFRMTGVNKKIEKSTYAELKDIKLKKSKETIPLLEDVLKLINGKVFLLIELKNYIIGPLEKEVLKILENYKNYAIQTFSLRSIYYLRKKAKCEVGLLIFNNFKRKFQKYIKIDFIAHSLILKSKLKTNKPLYIWKIKNEKDLEKARMYSDKFIVYIKNFIRK